MAASTQKPRIAAASPTTNPVDSSPCSNVRSVCVRDRLESKPSTPGWPARAKSITQEPMVKESVIIAAVAALSEMAAENSAIAPISKP